MSVESSRWPPSLLKDAFVHVSGTSHLCCFMRYRLRTFEAEAAELSAEAGPHGYGEPHAGVAWQACPRVALGQRAVLAGLRVGSGSCALRCAWQVGPCVKFGQQEAAAR